MIENLYVLYDKKAKIAFKPVGCHRNDVVPVRELTQITNDEKSIVHANPEDFVLIHIGTLDLETLEVQGTTARPVVEALDLKQKPQ